MTPNTKSKHKRNIKKTNYVFTIGIGYYTNKRARTRGPARGGADVRTHEHRQRQAPHTSVYDSTAHTSANHDTAHTSANDGKQP
jgi:hypothetical protein